MQRTDEITVDTSRHVWKNRILLVYGYDRKTKQDLTWCEISKRQLNDIITEIYRKKPRFINLDIYEDLDEPLLFNENMV